MKDNLKPVLLIALLAVFAPPCLAQDAPAPPAWGVSHCVQIRLRMINSNGTPASNATVWQAQDRPRLIVCLFNPKPNQGWAPDPETYASIVSIPVPPGVFAACEIEMPLPAGFVVDSSRTMPFHAAMVGQTLSLHCQALKPGYVSTFSIPMTPDPAGAVYAETPACWTGTASLDTLIGIGANDDRRPVGPQLERG